MTTQPEQEPVAWFDPVMKDVCRVVKGVDKTSRFTVPLYTSPPPRQPLTDDEIEAIVNLHTSDNQGYDIWCDGRCVARAIEAAHGIGDKT